MQEQNCTSNSPWPWSTYDITSWYWCWLLEKSRAGQGDWHWYFLFSILTLNIHIYVKCASFKICQFIVKGKHALSSGGEETKVFISYCIIKFLSWFNIHLAKVYIPNNLHTTQTCPSVYSLLKAGHRRLTKATYIIIIDDIKIHFLNLQPCSQGLRGVGRCKTLETRLINTHSALQ